ncbi:MAG TPA: hypothetical protein VLC08_12530 [Chitinolyticbacter sp.]|nr:hypothetical protein [Chitinolyticbacter sp.]
MPRIAIFSDSFGHYFHWLTGGHLKTLDQSAYGWLLGIIGYHRFQVTVFAGVGGNSGPMMLDRFPRDILAKLDQFDILIGGQSCANDFFGYDLSVESSYAAAEFMIRELRKAGKLVAWMTAAPQGSGRTNFSQARQDRQPAYNRKLQALQSITDGLLLLPLYRSTVNLSDTVAGEPRADMYGSDRIHLLGPGALEFGRQAGPVIDPWFPKIARSFSPREGNTDGYSGNLLPVGMPVMAGTTGTFTGIGVSGTVPTGYQLVRNGAQTTATCGGSIVPDSGGDWFRMALAGNGASALEQFQFITANSFHGQLVAGDIVDFTAEYEVDCSGGGRIQRLIHRMLHQYNGAVWVTATNYTAGQMVRGGSGDNSVYRALNTGTSGATKPMHTSGQASDGTVAWEYVSARLLVMDWNGTNNIDADYGFGASKLILTPGTIPQPLPWTPGLSQSLTTVGVIGGGTCAVHTRNWRPRKQL